MLTNYANYRGKEGILKMKNPAVVLVAGLGVVSGA